MPGSAGREVVVAATWLALAAVTPACGSDGYSVVLRLERFELAVRAEVYLVPSCAGISQFGRVPDAYYRSAALQPESIGAIGQVPSGRYGLYARAMTNDCRVFAAGCGDVRLEGDGSGTLTVSLIPITPIPCPPGFRCQLGACESDGADLDAGASADAAVDSSWRECEPGSVDETACFSCGMQSRICSPDGRWDDWGPCVDPGVCSPGEVREESECDPCSEQVCSDQCDWLPCALSLGNECEYQAGQHWRCCGADSWQFCTPDCRWGGDCVACNGCGC